MAAGDRACRDCFGQPVTQPADVKPRRWPRLPGRNTPFSRGRERPQRTPGRAPAQLCSHHGPAARPRRAAPEAHRSAAPRARRGKRRCRGGRVRMPPCPGPARGTGSLRGPAGSPRAAVTAPGIEPLPGTSAPRPARTGAAAATGAAAPGQRPWLADPRRRISAIAVE